jgi:hypothetical protein
VLITPKVSSENRARLSCSAFEFGPSGPEGQQGEFVKNGFGRPLVFRSAMVLDDALQLPFNKCYPAKHETAV